MRSGGLLANAFARGMCRLHYARWHKQHAVLACMVEGCSKPVQARGWCGAHYMPCTMTHQCCVQRRPISSKGVLTWRLRLSNSFKSFQNLQLLDIDSV